jgi:hypothetical protein
MNPTLRPKKNHRDQSADGEFAFAAYAGSTTPSVFQIQPH